MFGRSLSLEFFKQHFFKRLLENSKILEITSRSNKGGLFVEISEYHNGAKQGCLRVPKGTVIDSWALFGTRLRDYFLGKTTSNLEKKVVAGSGEFEKIVDMQKSQVWKRIKRRGNKGSDLHFVKHFLNITDQINQSESLGGFDFTKKSTCASVSAAGGPVHASHLRVSGLFLGGKTQPIVSGPSQVQAQHTATREKGSGQPTIALPRQSSVGEKDDNMRSTLWETGEEPGTQKEEQGEITSPGEGLGCLSSPPPRSPMTMFRWPIVLMQDRVLMEVVLSTDGE